jgi:hypothetical protein
MTAALGGAQSNDCGSLREAGLAYAALEIGQQSLTPHIAFKTSKDASRGFLHPQLGRLLCPAKYLIDFDANSTEWVFASVSYLMLMLCQAFCRNFKMGALSWLLKTYLLFYMKNLNITLWKWIVGCVAVEYWSGCVYYHYFLALL